MAAAIQVVPFLRSFHPPTHPTQPNDPSGASLPLLRMNATTPHNSPNHNTRTSLGWKEY